MSSFYNKYILPRVIHAVCQCGPITKQRQKVVPLAYGRVLEVGVGTGLNLAFYNASKVSQLLALDPSEENWSLAQSRNSNPALPVSFIKGIAEQIPIEDHSIDSIVLTYTLCTIPDVPVSLAEMKRVLKRNGVLIFCEHGMAPDKSVLRWQNALNPVWKRVGGGCNLNRDIPALIQDGPFSIEKMETMYIPGIKIASYNFWGIAKPK